MDLKLDIYEKRKVIKTYTADTYDLMFGTVEDLLDLVDIDNLQANDKMELLKAVAKVGANSLDLIKPLLKDIFDGLTDEDLRKTKLNDILEVLMQIIAYSINEITKGNKQKN